MRPEVDPAQIDEEPTRGSSSARSSSQRGGVRQKQTCEDHIRCGTEALGNSGFLTPDAVFQNNITEEGDKVAWTSWQKAAAGGDAHARTLLHAYQHRPAEARGGHRPGERDADPAVRREHLLHEQLRCRSQLSRVVGQIGPVHEVGNTKAPGDRGGVDPLAG